MGYNTIKLKNYLDVFEEKVAAAAITPGMLIELTTTDTKVQAHSTAGGNAIPIRVALESELEGEDIDTAYAADDRVQTWIPQRGDWGYLILADGENVSISDPLESAGNGYLQKHVADKESWESGSVQEGRSITIYPNQIVCTALEALDLSGSSGEESSGTLGYNKRIKVQFV